MSARLRARLVELVKERSAEGEYGACNVVEDLCGVMLLMLLELEGVATCKKQYFDTAQYSGVIELRRTVLCSFPDSLAIQ